MNRYYFWFITLVFHTFLLFNGICQEQKVDTRVWSIAYWQEMAKKGLVEVAKPVPVPPATFTGSTINVPKILNGNSPDVPIINSTNVTQSENSVFVNPLNNNKVLNSNNSADYPYTVFYGTSGFFTSDMGATWNGSVHGTGGSNNGDPATVINLNGKYFVGYITLDGGQGCAYSTNEGNTWTHVQIAPGPTGGFSDLLDKNHLWVDNSLSSAYQGNLYSAWTHFEGGHANNNDIELARSTDGGLSWSNPINISDAVNAGSHNQGINIQTGPNGEVYAVWAIYDSWPSDENALGFAKSTDGGATWQSATRIISNIHGIRNTGTSKNHRVNSFPVMAVDISGGPRNGWIYVVWANYGVPGINQGPGIDVYMIRSSDGGASWSAPIRVNQDPMGQGKEHYFPWITCDPVNGVLSVIFYDDRNVTATQCETFVAISTDGGNSWEDFKVSDVAFTPSPIPGFAMGYFGDYLGISARGNHIYPVWTDNRTGNALAYVSPFQIDTIEVLVDQQLFDGSSVDSVGRWEGGLEFTPYPVPHTFCFEIGSKEVLRGAQKIISNEKYHKWSKDDTVTNHREFLITGDFPNNLKSEFHPTKSGIILKNTFLSASLGTDPSNDVIDFKDPWLIDYPDPLYGNNKRNRGMAAPFKSRPSPFYPDYTTSYNGDVYQGVFLNQEIAPNKPYYSVRAQEEWVVPFHGRDITWYFQNWDGEHVVFQHPDQLETALVFQADGAVARANYKGHLVTGVYAPASNNSRQVLRDRLGYWHMVYEDNGNVYYTRSYDNGATWSAEKRLNAIIPGAVNSKPALGYSYELNLPVVVWDRQIGSNHFPVFVYSLPGNNWSQEISAESLVFSRENSTPAVTFIKYSETDIRAYVICKNENRKKGLALLYVSLDIFESQPSFAIEFIKLNGTNDSSKNPTICSDYTDPVDGKMYFAWEQDGKIVYNYYDAKQPHQPTHPVWSSPDGINGSWDSHPSIVYNGNNTVHIVWQHFDGEFETSFQHQYFHATNPLFLTAIKQVSLRGVNLTRPSIGCSTDGHTVAAVVQAGSQWRWLFFDGSQWTLSEEAIAGNLAGINAYGENFMAAWVDAQQGLPYLVNQTLLPQSALQERDNGSDDTDYREQLLNLSYLNNLNLRGKALLRLGNVKLQTAGGESEWPFFNPGDSLNTTEFLRTVPITVTPATASARLHYRVQLEDYNKPAQLLNAPLVRLGVFTPGSAQPLAVLFKVDLNALSNGSHLFEDSLTVDLSPWQNQTIELRMENIFALNGNNGRKPACIAEQVFLTGGGNSERMLAKTANENENPVLPKAFRLLPNYPNPFNPETRITFELPQASPVRLEIYDMSGRKIKTLVNKAYPAGRYEVVWNGRDGQNRPAASGIYLLRLRAGAFNATQKMVLMK